MVNAPNAPTGTVKCVLSGDTVVIRGRAVNGPPPERLLTFSFVSTPRFGRRGQSEDEPFAFEAREFLRKALVGKQISFRIDYVTAASGKEYGTVFVGEENITESLVAAGWAQVKPRQNTSEELVEFVERLTALETQAREKKLGVLSAGESRVINQNFTEDLRDFLQRHRKTPLDGIVEQVRDGSTFRVLLLDNMQMITLSLGGIKAPAYRKDVPGVEDLIEPFGEEAKFFVESRLLQRQVRVALEAVQSNGSGFVGTLLHPAGNISEALLANGLAQIIDWSIATVTGGPEKYREAENAAKSKKMRIWHAFEPKAAPKNVKELQFDGIVTRIVGGDTIMVESNATKVERKITLSSFRQPRPKEEAYYHQEAKEFLRARLIGQTVHVSVEYVRPPADGFEERICATVTLANINIAEALINKGLGGAFRHRRDDNDRSACYDSLLVAEDKAQKGKKGIFSDKEAPTVRVNDASENANKAKSFLPFFRRAGRVTAIVEYVLSANRFRVFIPKESAKATLALAGIRSPKSARSADDQSGSEPFGQEAMQFVNRCAMQRDCEIEVEGVDKSGCFLGSLWLKGSNEQLAVTLLKEGLAYVHPFSAERSPYSSQLFAAESEARSQNKRLWTVRRKASLESLELREPNFEPVELLPTEIIQCGQLYGQVAGADSQRLESLMSQLQRHHQESAAAAVVPVIPGTGDLLSAQFTEDDGWYRGRVRNVNSASKTAQIFYVDYGNTESLPFSRLRALPAQFTSLPGQAQEIRLAYLKSPALEQDYGTDAANLFKELISVQPKLKANIEYREGNILYAMVFTDSSVKLSAQRDGGLPVDASLNAELLRQGYAQLDSKTANRTGKLYLSQLKSAQDQARKSRRGVWEYGDFDLDEREEMI